MTRQLLATTINLLLFALLSTAVLAETPAQTPATDFINDYANILTEQEEEAIKAPLQELYQTNSAQVSFVIITSLEGKDAFGYAYEVAEGSLGDEKLNNGLLLLISVQDREYRFLTGRGIEADLPDALTSRIAQDFLIPSLKEDDYALGLLNTAQAIKATLLTDTASEYYPKKRSALTDIILFLLGNPFIIMVVIVILLSIFRKKKGDNDLLMALMLGSMLGRGKGGLGGGGGFGGFGGGSFGGGGSGGRF